MKLSSHRWGHMMVICGVSNEELVLSLDMLVMQ
jgi:hypothetical protein